MTEYYSNEDMVFEGNSYNNKLPSIPVIQKNLPEFLVGVTPPVTTSVVISNIDKALTALRATQQFRGKVVKIRELYLLEDNIKAVDDPSKIEVFEQYIGVVDSSNVGLPNAQLNLTNQLTDVLDSPFPKELITNDLWSGAIDTGFVVNEIVGVAKQVPISLILAQETPSVSYEYLVGRGGSLVVDNVYRDKLAIPKYTGTAQSGTSTTIRLAAATSKDDDFFNDYYVRIMSGTGAGQQRLITDYVSSTDTATVDSAWTVNPNSSSVYEITEWGVFTEIIGPTTYTKVRFVLAPQRDFSENQYTRDAMSADVTGPSSETNPARVVRNFLEMAGASINTTSFNNAEADITSIGNLVIGGAAVEQQKLIDILDKVCLVGRLSLKINEVGEYEAYVYKEATTYGGIFKSNDNIVALESIQEESLNDSLKTIAVSYRRLFSSDELRLTTEKKTVLSEGKVDRVIENEWIYDKTTADKVAQLLANTKAAQDQPLKVSLNHEARALDNFNIIKLEIPILNIDALYQVIRTEISDGRYAFTTIPYNASVFDWVVGTLPSDPVTDDQADFRFTPPDAVTSFGVVWSITSLNVSAKATLSWVNPTINFKDVLIRYKKTSDSVFTSVGRIVGTTVEIPGLIPGQTYDFEATSYNKFDLDGGTASISGSLAPGDTAAPSTPTGLIFSRKFRTFSAKITPNPETDIKHYVWQIWSATVQIGDDIIGGTELEFTESGTTSISRKVRVKAVDLSNNSSSYTSFSSTLTTETFVQDDITDDEITNKARATVSSITLSPAGTTIISASITKRTGTRIRVEFSMAIETGTGFSTWSVELRRDSSIIQDPWCSAYLPTSGTSGVAAVYDDNISAAGTYAYSVVLNFGSSNHTGRNLSLRLVEYRR